MYVRNLHRHNCRGVVVSWARLGQARHVAVKSTRTHTIACNFIVARLGQAGHSHINNHDNNYVIELFEDLGYTYLTNLTRELRHRE